MTKYTEHIGRMVSFRLKPALMRDWIVVRETPRCLVVRKSGDSEGRYHLSKKLIDEVIA